LLVANKLGGESESTGRKLKTRNSNEKNQTRLGKGRIPEIFAALQQVRRVIQYQEACG